MCQLLGIFFAKTVHRYNSLLMPNNLLQPLVMDAIKVLAAGLLMATRMRECVCVCVKITVSVKNAATKYQ